MKLVVFGLGYTASHYGTAGTAFSEFCGTARHADRIDVLARAGLDVLAFDGETGTTDPALADRVAACDLCLVSIQPGREGDPVLMRFGRDLARAPRLRSVVYLSTIGVYGDHGGAWIDEATPPVPESERGRVRLAVEREWLSFARDTGKAVQILRLAGIYGPGRNALDDLADGTARCIDKPGQVFNRIHVADIGRAVDRAFAYGGGSRAWNVTDDEPAPAPDVVAFAARLMGVPPPALIPFADAAMSPMARSFYGANRRVANTALKGDLGVRLAFPTYRDGLTALWREGAGHSAPPREAG